MKTGGRTLVALALGAVWLAGCIELKTHVRLHADGSATITERVRFSKQLLDLASKEGENLRLAPLLEKKTALDRVKLMGEGAQLVSHKVTEVAGGAKESVTVYKIPNIGDLTYVSPFLGRAGYPHRARFTISPNLKNAYKGYRAGEMTVHIRAYGVKESRPVPKRGRDAPVPKPPSPEAVQPYRELTPIFRDMLKDFHVRLIFECFAPLRSQEGIRGGVAWMSPLVCNVRKATIVDFDDKLMDKYGYRFIENEELMIDLLRWDLGSPTMQTHLRDWQSNTTLPVLRSGMTLWFPPSKQLFDKYFVGKTLDYGEKGGGKRKANFNRIGFKERD